MNGKGAHRCLDLYVGVQELRQPLMVLKNVKYGIEFHFELTGIRNDAEADGEKKHFNIIKRRLENGQWFRSPCLGCSEFPAKRIELVEDFDKNLISSSILGMGDYDFLLDL